MKIAQRNIVGPCERRMVEFVGGIERAEEKRGTFIGQATPHEDCHRTHNSLGAEKIVQAIQGLASTPEFLEIKYEVLKNQGRWRGFQMKH